MRRSKMLRCRAWILPNRHFLACKGNCQYCEAYTLMCDRPKKIVLKRTQLCGSYDRSKCTKQLVGTGKRHSLDKGLDPQTEQHPCTYRSLRKDLPIEAQPWQARTRFCWLLDCLALPLPAVWPGLLAAAAACER